MLFVGVIGVTGRMGELLSDVLQSADGFCMGRSCSGRLSRDSEHADSHGSAVFSDIDSFRKFLFNNADVLDKAEGLPVLREPEIFAHFRDECSCDPELLRDFIETILLNDYVVDFSHSSATDFLIKLLRYFPKPSIICTSGWNAGNLYIKEASQCAPIIIAPNTSIGASLQMKQVRDVAKFLAEQPVEYDVDIVDVHHRNKVDDISGTAIALKDAVADGYGVAPENVRFGSVKAGGREAGYVSIASMRRGNVYGEHEVIFCSENEEISISHKVLNRKVFAEGAIEIIRKVEHATKDSYEGGQSQLAPGIYYAKDILLG